jgi:hypothetical protein
MISGNRVTYYIPNELKRQLGCDYETDNIETRLMYRPTANDTVANTTNGLAIVLRCVPYSFQCINGGEIGEPMVLTLAAPPTEKKGFPYLIVLPCVIVSLLIIIIVVVCVRRRRKQQREGVNASLINHSYPSSHGAVAASPHKAAPPLLPSTYYPIVVGNGHYVTPSHGLPVSN